MDEVEAESNMGQFGKNAPFGMWKTVWSLCFLAVAISQLYELWA